MKKNRILNWFAPLLLIISLCSCDTTDFGSKKKEPVYVLTLNDIVKYPRAQSIEKEVPTYAGRTIWINTNAYLHSRNIMDIEMIPSAQKKGFYDLQVKLDYHGKLAWLQLSVSHAYGEVGLLVDGVFYRAITPDRIASEYEDTVIIRGQFDPVTAKSLKDNAKLNYRIFNGEPKDEPFSF
ncbi:MAG TPA: hypothetical protein DCZ94_04495 [Lentisphaeria bacterium]|nr:MAG: hypothetical protein A2X48_20275 [Lentisphaerae bacterium GWF2_49_21]HBC86196.1 hypothetical protein [Lentisphaeria bacterium]